MAQRNDEKEEHPLVLAGLILAVLFVFGFLIWMVASNRIVYGTLTPALFFGALWKIFPSDFAIGQWNSIVIAVRRFAENPTDVSVVDWAGLVNAASRPLVFLIVVGYVVFALYASTRRRTFMRKFSADELMEYSVKKFTGIAPVVKIRKDIAQDKNPLWRRQVSPEEVFNTYKATPLDATFNVLVKPGMPMSQGDKFDREVARAYFTGFLGYANKEQGRMNSRMLGRQVVNLLTDASKSKSVVFPDRLSNEGKAVFALWAAVAFGDVAGREEYNEYRDKLNMSAYGSKDGMANLSVIQPLYNKYRTNVMANRMFAVYHWEHTFLFALLAVAQRKGRYTTAEVLWLRPMNRVMFFSLNTRGSFTPHTEAGTTFSQFAYETGCAKYSRLPMVRNSTGDLVHLIFTDKVVDGMLNEWNEWNSALEDDEDIWATKDVWKRASLTVKEHFKQVEVSVPVTHMPGTNADDVTAYDLVVSAEAEEVKKREEAELRREVKATSGDDSEDVLGFLNS